MRYRRHADITYKVIKFYVTTPAGTLQTASKVYHGAQTDRRTDGRTRRRIARRIDVIACPLAKLADDGSHEIRVLFNIAFSSARFPVTAKNYSSIFRLFKLIAMFVYTRLRQNKPRIGCELYCTIRRLIAVYQNDSCNNILFKCSQLSL